MVDVADVQAHQGRHHRAVDAGVLAVFIARAVQAGRRNLHQAIGTADARGIGGARFAAQPGHRAAHQIDLRPAQLKAFERLTGFSLLAQTGDLTIGHVEHH